MAEVTVCYEGPIVTRDDALARGLTHYFTGHACVHGHVDLRFVCDYCCRQCRLVRNVREESRAARQRYKRTEKGKAADRAYKERHKDALDRWFVSYRQTERGKSLAKARKVRFRKSQIGKAANNRDCGKRRARQYGKGGGRFTAADEWRLRERQKKCHICGKRFTKTDPAELDHIVALADGGPHDASNIALAHRSCNRQKHATRTHLI